MARIQRTGLHAPFATYLFPFNDEYYNVPVENVLLYAKFTNCVPARHIHRVLNSESPLNWRNYLTSGRVLHIRGMEGSAVYTTFVASDDHGTPNPDAAPEQRVLHQIPHAVADAYFAMFKEWALCAYPEPRTSRQNARINVYNWRKGIHLPDHDGIDPVANGWPLADISAPSIAQLGSPASALQDPMADWDAHIVDVEASLLGRSRTRERQQVHLRPRSMRNDEAAQGPLLSSPPPPRVVVRPSHCLTQDLRTLSDFLFECKDLVPEGAYLAASDALKRVWEQCPL